MTKNSYSYYNGETYALISNDKKRRVFLNDPKRWFVSKTQAITRLKNAYATRGETR